MPRDHLADDEIVLELAGAASTGEVTALAERFFIEEGFETPSGGLGPSIAEYISRDGQAISLARRNGRIVGFATINSLLAVITPMRNLPGRKTIIFFSEGLALPQSVQTKFPAVINAANRANVSIYAIDSAGLRIESGAAERSHGLTAFYARLGFVDRGRRLVERPLP